MTTLFHDAIRPQTDASWLDKTLPATKIALDDVIAATNILLSIKISLLISYSAETFYNFLHS